jgi:phosphate butyryltransferase
MLNSWKDLINQAKKKKTKRILVVIAQDEDVLKSTSIADKEGFAKFTLVGDHNKIKEIASKNSISLDEFEIIHESDYHNSIEKSIALVRNGVADLLMKGKVQTPDLMKAVLNKEKGLRSSQLLSHVGVFETPHYHKLIFVTDGAINIAPDLEKKVQILKNTLTLTLSLGIKSPKIAGVCAVENVTQNMPATIDAAILSVMCQRGQLGDCILEGPLGLDNAVSLEAAQIKGIKTSIAGDVDVLLVPNIESGNITVKALTYLSKAKLGGIVLGATCPIILVSRADTYEAKLNSIALAVSMDHP